LGCIEKGEGREFSERCIKRVKKEGFIGSPEGMLRYRKDLGKKKERYKKEAYPSNMEEMQVQQGNFL